MYKLLILAMAITLLSCSNKVKTHNTEVAATTNSTELTTFQVPGGWGYSVAVNGHKFIQQETIPVVQGKQAFKTKADAEKVGNWVASRIQKNEAFSITLPELKNLIAINSN